MAHHLVKLFIELNIKDVNYSTIKELCQCNVDFGFNVVLRGFITFPRKTLGKIKLADDQPSIYWANDVDSKALVANIGKNNEMFINIMESLSTTSERDIVILGKFENGKGITAVYAISKCFFNESDSWGESPFAKD